jgi:hypothetical protein
MKPKLTQGPVATAPGSVPEPSLTVGLLHHARRRQHRLAIAAPGPCAGSYC